MVVTRDIKLSQYVTPGTTLFRISDFTPLLCRVEVPEKDFPRIRVGQPAHIRVEAYPGDSFTAEVARLRPTIDAATGTFTVTLEVEGQGKLRPGMFASVYLQTDTHADAIVIPRDALVLDSLGDTVFVKTGDEAERREVRLGLRSENSVEVLEGLAEGDLLIVAGQDGLADGTPVTVIGDEPRRAAAEASSGPPPEASRDDAPTDEGTGHVGRGDRAAAATDARRRWPRHGSRARAEGGGRGGGMGTGGRRRDPAIHGAADQRGLPRGARRHQGADEGVRGLSDERIEEIITQIRGEGGS